MMMHDEFIGQTFELNSGDGATLQDLYEFLRKMPRRARENYMQVFTGDRIAEITGIAFAQSDQAEKWEFKVYLKTDQEGK